MLAADDRQTLLDALRPPPGYRLGCAVGTTFSLHLDAALTAPAAFAFHAVSDARDPRDVEPLELLDSIRRHADRFTVFFQAGQVAVPQQRRLFAYLEGAVVPTIAPGGGVFHPKVWVLRFEADAEPPVYRALCTSRNLTYDRSWDTVLRLDSMPVGDDQGGDVDPAGLAAFVAALPGLAIGPIRERRLRDITRLSEELASVSWSAPAGVSAGRFLPIGLAGSMDPPFPAIADRLAVISPFLRSGLLKQLPAASGRRALVSRPDQLLSCRGAVLDRFDEVYTLSPDAIPGDAPEGVTPNSVPVTDSNLPFEGLHAKLYVFDQGDEATVLTGSANATMAAFGANVELLTELQGPVRELGVEALLAEPAKDVQTLKAFLTPFPLDAEGPIEEPNPIEDQLDVLRRAIAAARVEATALPVEGADRFVLRFTGGPGLPALPDGVEWRCWPISLGHGAARPGEAGALDVEFTVSFEAITAFLASELRLGDVITRFVIVADLLQAPDNRSTRLLRILLGDAERFLRYLLLLLTDDVIDLGDPNDLLNAVDADTTGRWGPAPDTVPLLEAFLRTLASEPERLEHVHHLITDLRSDPEGDTLLPPRLLEIWEPIWAAAKERRA